MNKGTLAYLPDEEVSEILSDVEYKQKTDKTITKENDLIADLKKTKIRGYSIRDEEYVEGIIAISAPISNLKENRPVGAVCFDFYPHQCSLEISGKGILGHPSQVSKRFIERYRHLG